jgi:hypothetical protein
MTKSIFSAVGLSLLALVGCVDDGDVVERDEASDTVWMQVDLASDRLPPPIPMFECDKKCSYRASLWLELGAEENQILDYLARYPDAKPETARIDVLKLTQDGTRCTPGEIPATPTTPRGYCDDGVRKLVERSTTFTLATYHDASRDELRVKVNGMTDLMSDELPDHTDRSVRIVRLDYDPALPDHLQYRLRFAWE